MSHPELHPALEPIAFLLGTWSGPGEGTYPTIDDFDYIETATFSHVGKPFLAYNQRTKHPESGQPMHAESGYVRPIDATTAELVLSQPSGIVEVHTGLIEASTVTFSSVAVVGSPSAKEVVSVTRVIEVDGDVLSYRLAMGAVGVPHQHHLAASLRRSAPS